MRTKKDRIPLSDEDKAFIEDIYTQHRSLIYHAAMRLSCDKQVASELTQECMVRLLQNVPSLRRLECSQIDAYIVVVLKRLYWKYRITEQRANVLSIAQPSVAYDVDLLAAALAMESEKSRIDLIVALEQLSPRDRMLLEGYYIEGRTMQELAKDLGCKEDSIRMLLSRARKRAKAILEGEAENG